MNWFGIAPPFTASTNSKPLPRGSGSMRRYTSPNWPAPPVCFLWRPWPPAPTPMVSRDGNEGGVVSSPGVYFDDNFVRVALGSNFPRAPLDAPFPPRVVFVGKHAAPAGNL